MASVGLSTATAALVGLLFAGTIGVDGVATVWVAIAWADLPAAVHWSAVGVATLGMAALTIQLMLATWRVERRGLTALDVL